MSASATTGDAHGERPLVTLADVERAYERVKKYVHRTPLLTSTTLDAMASEACGGGGDVRVRLAFKSEHLQRVGAFKMRGATNAVQAHLEHVADPSKLWVVTHSSGNHAAAVACAARSVGARAAVVMPRTAPEVKKAAVAGYGARIVECEPTQQARERTAAELMDVLRKEDADRFVEFVHPYDEALVIGGQGTLALEMLEQAKALQGRRACSEASELTPDRFDERAWSSRREADEPVLDIVVAPVGGGGMLSGVSTYVKGKDDRIRVIAAEPEMADDAQRSFATGILQPPITPPKTICDGLLTALSPFTLQHVQRNVKDILTASEAHVLHALRLIWERMKQMIEPSAAVGVAVILHNEQFRAYVRQVAEQKRQAGLQEEVRIGVVWTGGNVEVEKIVQAFASLSSS